MKISLNYAVVDVDYPQVFIRGEAHYNKLLNFELIDELEAWTNKEQASAHLKEFLKKEIPTSSESLLIHKEEGPFLALVIEKLPPWRTRQPSRHGEHLAVTSLVFDPEDSTWWLIARHGRGQAKARFRPYANKEEALKRMDELAPLYLNRIIKVSHLISPEAYKESLRRFEKIEDVRLEVFRKSLEAENRPRKAADLLY